MRGSAAVARWAHNPEVAGSIPAPATNPRLTACGAARTAEIVQGRRQGPGGLSKFLACDSGRVKGPHFFGTSSVDSDTQPINPVAPLRAQGLKRWIDGRGFTVGAIPTWCTF